MLPTGERSIVFNSVMQTDFLQIERVTGIAFVQHAGGVMAHIVAKGGAKVVCRTKKSGQFGELDTSSATCYDS